MCVKFRVYVLNKALNMKKDQFNSPCREISSVLFVCGGVSAEPGDSISVVCVEPLRAGMSH